MHKEKNNIGRLFKRGLKLFKPVMTFSCNIIEITFNYKMQQTMEFLK